jgi:serine phosphatase RsbU (regulator of sigma subunit)
MEKKLQNEKKQQEIELLKKNESIRNIELKRQKTITYGLTIFILVIVILLFFIFKNLREKKRANILLERKNTEIASQKLVIEEKNKDIIDSIKYAERLQKTILPPMKIINEIVPDSFVFFKPKDIVSGDFYWIEKTAQGILFAVIDCTGHGVPGAMMSIVGNNLLNKIVKEKGITQPGKILNELLGELFLALRQNADEIKANDGMDLTICSFDPDTRVLSYAGAFNPVLIARNSEIIELKTDKFSVGKYAYEHKFSYKEESFQLQKNDVVYLSTDGYSDQFGGDKGKKLMRKNFYQVLQKISHLNKEEQIIQIEEQFDKWKGTYEQLDDITVFGFRV